MASPVWVSANALAGANANTAAFTYPASLAAGDIVVAHFYRETNFSAVTAPDGTWTRKATVTTGVNVHEQQIWWKRCVGGESGTVTFTWTGTADFRGGNIHRITGCSPSGDPFAAFTTNFNDTSSFTTPAVSLTGTPPNSLLFWTATNFNGSSTWTVPTGFGTGSTTVVTVGAPKDNTAGGDTGSITGSSNQTDTMTAFLGVLSSGGADETAPPPRNSLRLAPTPPPLSQAGGALVGPPVAMQVWSGADLSTLQVAAEQGSGAAVAVATATESKVAVQTGSLVATSHAATAVEKKVAPQAGSANTAAAGSAVEKRVTPQAGSAATTPAGSAVEKKVAVQVAVSAAAAVAAAVESTLLSNLEWSSFEFPLEWFPRMVWAGADEPRGQTAAEGGTAAVATVTTAALEKKVAVQTGSCAAGPAAVSSTKKVSLSQGSAATAAAGAAAEKKVASERGTAAAAAVGTGVDSSGSVRLERGTAAAGPATSAVEKKVAVQGGVCGAASAGSSACRKVAKSSGAAVAGPSTRCVHSKKVTQLGRLCAAAASWGTIVSQLRPVPTRVATGPETRRAATGVERWRVSSGAERTRVSTGAERVRVSTENQMSRATTGLR